jgi:hypothetical protein
MTLTEHAGRVLVIGVTVLVMVEKKEDCQKL